MKEPSPQLVGLLEAALSGEGLHIDAVLVSAISISDSANSSIYYYYIVQGKRYRPVLTVRVHDSGELDVLLDPGPIQLKRLVAWVNECFEQSKNEALKAPEDVT